MSFTTVSNNPQAASQTGAQRHEMVESDGAGGVMKDWIDTVGLVARVGRGQTDRNITYLALKNTNGTTIYTYPNAAGDGLITTSVLP